MQQQHIQTDLCFFFFFFTVFITKYGRFKCVPFAGLYDRFINFKSKSVHVCAPVCLSLCEHASLSAPLAGTIACGEVLRSSQSLEQCEGRRVPLQEVVHARALTEGRASGVTIRSRWNAWPPPHLASCNENPERENLEDYVHCPVWGRGWGGGGGGGRRQASSADWTQAIRDLVFDFSMGLIFCTWADIFISKSWINLWTPVANVWNRMNAPVCSKGTEKVQQQLKDTMYASVSTQVLPSLLPSPCVSIYLFLCAVQHVEGGENAGMWAKDGRNIFFESTMTLWYPASGSFTVDKSPVSDESQKIENQKRGGQRLSSCFSQVHYFSFSIS